MLYVYNNTAFVCIDTHLTKTESSDLPTSLVQEIVSQPEAISTEATAAVIKGILRVHLMIHYILSLYL